MADELTDEQKAAKAAETAAAKADAKVAADAAAKAKAAEEAAAADAARPTVSMTVAKAFTLTRAYGDEVHYSLGVHSDVPAADAEHWFTQSHLAVEAEPAETAE